MPHVLGVTCPTPGKGKQVTLTFNLNYGFKEPCSVVCRAQRYLPMHTWGRGRSSHPPCWVMGGQRLPATKAAHQKVQPGRGLCSQVRVTMVGCHQLTKPCAPGAAREGTKRWSSLCRQHTSLSNDVPPSQAWETLIRRGKTTSLPPVALPSFQTINSSPAAARGLQHRCESSPAKR